MKVLFVILIFVYSLFASGIGASIEYRDLLRDKEYQCGILEGKEYVFFTGCSSDITKSIKSLKNDTYFEAELFIKKYYLSGVDFKKKLITSKNMKKYIVEYVAKYGLPLNISKMPMAQVDRNRYNKKYITAIAISKDTLSKYKNDFLKGLKDVKYYIADILTRFKENENFHELANFYLQLHLIDLAMIYKQKELSKNYYLQNYYIDNNPFSSRKVYEDILLNRNYNLDYLYSVPVQKNLIDKLIDIKQNDPLAILTLKFLSDPKDYQDIIQLVDQVDSTKLYKPYYKFILSLNPFNQNSDLFKMINKTKGNIYFSNNIPIDQNNFFKRAKHLFYKMGDLKEIEKLLIEALKVTPSMMDIYDYLIEVYKQEKKYKKELLMCNVMLRFEPTNKEILIKKADILKEFGFDQISKYYYNYINSLR